MNQRSNTGDKGDKGDKKPARPRRARAAESAAQAEAEAKAKRDRHKNLFERYDIDPRQGPRAITERLRELAEDAPTDAERAEVRAAWEELTVHPMRRLRAAIGAHPETRPAIGAPPPADRRPAGVDLSLSLSELAVRPSIARALGGRGVTLTSRREALQKAAAVAAPPDSLDDDPILQRATDVR